MDAVCNFIAAGLGIGISIPVTWKLLERFIGAYTDEKLKNLATKQDIAAITTKIEEAKQPFFELQEQIKASHQLRFAAIDKRLEVHQEAFLKWIELLHSLHKANKLETIDACMNWYRKHCLYLEPEVRVAFSSACYSAQDHDSYLNEDDKQAAKDNFNVIMAFPKILFETIQLTPISDTELKNIKDLNKDETNDQ